jgi:hypothetical protein
MKRTSTARSKNGPLTRLAARKAILAVKANRSSSADKQAAGIKEPSPTLLKRYLGHFGVGPASTADKKTPAKKSGATKKAASLKSAATKRTRSAS